MEIINSGSNEKAIDNLKETQTVESLSSKEVLQGIKDELRIMNIHLETITNNNIKIEDLPPC